MKKLAIFLLIISHTSVAQLPSSPVDILRNFPATELLQTINNLQIDLKNCEKTNTTILTSQQQANTKLTQILSSTQLSLQLQSSRADSLSQHLHNIQLLTKSAKKDIHKANVWNWLEKTGTIALGFFLGSTIK